MWFFTPRHIVNRPAGHVKNFELVLIYLFNQTPIVKWSFKGGIWCIFTLCKFERDKFLKYFIKTLNIFIIHEVFRTCKCFSYCSFLCRRKSQKITEKAYCKPSFKKWNILGQDSQHFIIQLLKICIILGPKILRFLRLNIT